MSHWKELSGLAVTVYPFASNGPFQLTLNVGDLVAVTEENDAGWLKGILVQRDGLANPVGDRATRGIFPRNYVQLKSASSQKAKSYAAGQSDHSSGSYSTNDSVVSDLDVVLREWSVMLKSFYQAKRYREFRHLRNRLSVLVDLRRELTAPGVSEVLRNTLSDEVLANIEEGRRLLGLDLIPRTTQGDPADESNTGVISLYRMHHDMDPFLSEKGQKAAKKRDASSTNAMLLLEFKALMCAIGEDTEAFFSIYSKKERSFVSEEFFVSLNSMGMPTDVDKIGNIKTLFEDLSVREIPSDDTYLVCRFVRRGRLVYNVGEMNLGTMGSSSKKGKNKPIVLRRRPFAVAVLKLDKEVMEKGNQMEHILPLYSATSENLFATLHENLINETGKEYEEIPRSKGTCVSVSLLHGDGRTIRKDHPELQTIPSTPKRGFPEVIAVGTDRDDLYLRVVSGTFQQDRKTVPKNVSATMTIVTDTGQTLPNCITLGTDNTLTSYQSPVIYHKNDPLWNESVRINVPAQHFNRAYVMLTFCHVSSSEKPGDKEKPYAVTSFKLVDPQKGTVVQNGPHSLSTFKPPSKIEGNDAIAAILKGTDVGDKPLQVRKETVKVDTLLCSTRRVQNEALEALLKWNSQRASLNDVLKNFTFIEHIELVKFLREIFDALFSILAMNVDDANYSDVNSIPYLVYNALCYIVSLLVDDKTSRFTNFRPVLDTYITRHFGEAKAHIALVRCLRHYLSHGDDMRMAKQVRTSMRALEYIFKFIIASHKLYSRTGRSVADAFKTELEEVLDFINKLMALEPQWVIGAQTLAVKYFSSILGDLRKVFDVEQLSIIVRKFIESIPQRGKHQLDQEKLLLLVFLTGSEMVIEESPREILLPALLNTIQFHLTVPEDKHQAVSILAGILKVIQDHSKQKGSLYYLTGFAPMTLSLLQLLNELGAAGDKEEATRALLCACVLSLIGMMDASVFTEYVLKPLPFVDVDADEKKEEKEGGDGGDGDGGEAAAVVQMEKGSGNQLVTLLTEIGGLLRTRTFPENWSVLHMYMRAVLVRIVRWTLEYIESELINRNQFVKSVGTAFFVLCYDIAMDEMLQLERFTEEKKTNIHTKHGDIRAAAVALICELWELLDASQSLYVPELVPYVIHLLKIPHTKIQSAVMDLYFGIMCREAMDNGRFLQVERTTVSVMIDIDAEYIEGTYRGLFVNMLTAQFEAFPELQTAGLAFIDDIKELLELVSALRTLQGPEHDDERTVVTLRLMDYLLGTDRKEAYIKYVGTLVDMHVINKNFAEAGLTALLHADLCSWDPNAKMVAVGTYPAESQRDRKIKVYREAINLLDKGKYWEKAIELVREMKEQYEHMLYDYAELAALLELEATLFRKIVEQERFYAEYFRVAFWGKGFSRDLRGKEFVYRGQELERLADFVGRMRDKFPDAELLQSNKRPGDEIVSGPGKYIQVCTVTPSTIEEMKGEDAPVIDSKLPESIARFRQNNAKNVFFFSRPFRRGPKSDNEFKDLWLCITYLQTEDSFPTVKRRSQVANLKEVEASPITNALKSIVEKNRSLEKEVIANEKHTGRENYESGFTMSLNGVIDAAVNGGVYKYKDAFFNEVYVQNNPEHVGMVADMKKALKFQLEILARGLVAHDVVCPDEMRALHEKLITFYAKMKEDLEPSLM